MERNSRYLSSLSQLSHDTSILYTTVTVALHATQTSYGGPNAQDSNSQVSRVKLPVTSNAF